MTKMQMTALETAKNIFNTNEFTEKDWTKVACGKYSLTTAVHNGDVKVVKHVARTWYTLDEVVKMLNDCSGSDCYDCDWNLKVENGRAYEDEITYTYCMA